LDQFDGHLNEAELAAMLREHALSHAVPGAAIGVLRDGTATTACYGTGNVTTTEPVTADTRFSVGSLTKSMVGTAIARLADSGRLGLNDLVAAHVPGQRLVGWA